MEGGRQCGRRAMSAGIGPARPVGTRSPPDIARHVVDLPTIVRFGEQFWFTGNAQIPGGRADRPFRSQRRRHSRSRATFGSCRTNGSRLHAVGDGGGEDFHQSTAWPTSRRARSGVDFARRAKPIGKTHHPRHMNQFAEEGIVAWSHPAMLAQRETAQRNHGQQRFALAGVLSRHSNNAPTHVSNSVTWPAYDWTMPSRRQGRGRGKHLIGHVGRRGRRGIARSRIGLAELSGASHVVPKPPR